MRQNNNSQPEKLYKEAVRFYRNAKGTLKRARVEYGIYQDTKPVQEACGTAYLAMLKALDGYLLKRGIDPKTLPHSFQVYESFLQKHLVHNGKVRGAIITAYDNLHVAGYYQGNRDPRVIKAGFGSVRFVIEHLTGNKVA